MRLLVQRNVSRFAESLSKFGIECKVVENHQMNDRSYRHIHLWRRFTKEFNNLIDDFKPDAILSSPSDFGSAALRSNIPLIVYLHGNYWREEETKRRINRTFLNRITHKRKIDDMSLLGTMTQKRYIATLDRCMRGSNVILSVSEYLSEIVQKEHLDKPAYTLYLGVDPALWYPEKGIILKHPCVGLVQMATVYDKAQEMYILKRVMDRLPKVNFYWAGSGKYAGPILKYLKECPNFTHLGYLNHPDKIRQFYTEIDIYALLTGLDAIPQTIKEASMIGKPVIATDVGGVHEAMDDGKTGFLVRRGLPDDIVDKISYLLEDKKRASVMGQCGRDYVKKNFSFDTAAKRMVNILKETGLWK